MANFKRTKLHTKEMMDWLKKHSYGTASKKYIFLPEELKKNVEITKIFRVIDTDGSSLNNKIIYLLT